MNRIRLAISLSLFCAIVPLPFAVGASYEPASVSAPAVAREFRAGWIATVGNIDWPSRKDLTTAEQKAELLTILDQAAKLRMNAVVFQVRPACDALYISQLEPWSEYLTGTMGKAPEPLYDPLAFAIEEAHKRGLELHAWFNPYRALHTNAKSTPSATHISKTRPELVRKYNGYLWLDPGEREVQQHSLNVLLDVVKRYGVDGVHFDDYFYPYKETSNGRDVEFPDEASWKKYGANGKLSRDDWRRANVDTFIERVYKSVKATKPWVKFGVSPFGIWRPGNPPQIKGFDAYEGLYADSKKWLREGWVDYFAPQLYWSIAAREQSFPVLLNWWDDQNPKQRHIWPGIDTTKIRRTTTESFTTPTANRTNSRPRTSWEPTEIVSQIKLAQRQSPSGGHIHWNMRSLLRSTELQTALQSGPYAEPALVPASKWLTEKAPAKPQLQATPGSSSVKLGWDGATETTRLWVLQMKQNGKWVTRVLPATTRSTIVDGVPEAIVLSGVNRIGEQGTAASLRLKN